MNTEHTSNPIVRTHQFLLARCDGSHADRYLMSLKGTRFDPCSAKGKSDFEQLSHQQQVQICVNYWTNQAVERGYISTEDSITHCEKVALANFDEYLKTLLHLIIEENLPICTSPMGS